MRSLRLPCIERTRRAAVFPYNSQLLTVRGNGITSRMALGNGASVNALIKMPVREKIGRYKYTLEANLDEEYESVMKELEREVADCVGKEDF